MDVKLLSLLVCFAMASATSAAGIHFIQNISIEDMSKEQPVYYSDEQHESDEQHDSDEHLPDGPSFRNGCPSGFFSIKGSFRCLKMFKDVHRTWAEAKMKCEIEGLVMPTHTDDIAVDLRKYLLDNYGTRSPVWLGASGDGFDMRWLQQPGDTDNGHSGRSQVVGITNPLWNRGVDTYDFNKTQCLELVVSEKWLGLKPVSPYGPWPCSTEGLGIQIYTLCQDLINARSIPV